MPEFVIWRSEVQAGGISAVYSPDGLLADQFRLSQNGASYSAIPWQLSIRNATDIDSAYFRGFVVPSVPAGTYDFLVNTPEGWISAGQLNIVPTPAPRPWVDIPPGENSLAVRAALEAGNNVMLLPGLHLWRHRIDLPAWAQIAGAHRDLVVVKRLPEPVASHAPKDRVFVPSAGGWNRISNLTIESDCNAAISHHDTLLPPSTVVENCRFRGMSGFQHGLVGWLIDNCDFERTLTYNYGGLYRNCRWSGPVDRIHYTTATEPSAMEYRLSGNSFTLDCEMSGTGRGPIVSWGGGHHVLIGGTVRNVQHFRNKNEAFLVECSTPAKSIYLSHYRVNNCQGPTVQVSLGGVERFLIDDLSVIGPGQLVIADGMNTHLRVVRSELTGNVWIGTTNVAEFPDTQGTRSTLQHRCSKLNQTTNHYEPWTWPAVDGGGTINVEGLVIDGNI